MKLLVTIDFPPEHGGIQKYLHNIVKYTYSCDDLVIAGCSSPLRNPDDSLSCKVLYISTFLSPLNKKFSLIPLFIKLALVLMKKKGNLSIEAGNIYAAFVPFLLSFSKPLRYSVYCYGKELFPLGKVGFRQILFRKILNRAEKIFYLSGCTLSILRKSGISGSFIHVPPKIKLPADYNRHCKTLSASVINLLTVGRLVPHKGHTVLIRATEILPENLKWHLTIAGSGPMYKHLKSLIISKNLQNRISIRNDLTDMQLADLYSSSDIFIFPSLETSDGVEGFGIVLLEAMSYKLPIIASQTGAIPEVLSDGECGILVSPDNPGEICDAVVNLFKNASLREKLVRNAALRLEKHYAWK
jgi:glycosyltransferase involved in cell wall biosynthesis